MLFQQPHDDLPDKEIAAVLRQAITNAGRLPRSADLLLAGICADYLVNELRAAGLIILRPVPWRLHR